MSAIANFKKRREAEKAQQSPTATETTATPAPENEALHLLAYIRGCDVDSAIEQGRNAAEEKAKYSIGIDPAKDAGKTAIATVTTDEQGNITSVTEYGPFDVSHDENGKIIISGGLEQTAAELEDSAATVSDSADKVSSAAGDLESAASSVDDSASNLAYTADDLGQVAAELKEATAELKKPSAAQESSHGAKAAAPKSSSKKSG
jgi:methyl-accepting chemotaxis protein